MRLETITPHDGFFRCIYCLILTCKKGNLLDDSNCWMLPITYYHTANVGNLSGIYSTECISSWYCSKFPFTVFATLTAFVLNWSWSFIILTDCIMQWPHSMLMCLNRQSLKAWSALHSVKESLHLQITFSIGKEAEVKQILKKVLHNIDNP